jgi:hypothetical protein
MQIDSALPSTSQATARAAKNASLSSADENDEAASRSSNLNTSEQDAAVHISSEGAAAAALAPDAASEGASGSDSSAVKSFAYGTLGLERPDQPHEERNAFYTAGRWLAAGITLGGIISLLI